MIYYAQPYKAHSMYGMSSMMSFWKTKHNANKSMLHDIIHFKVTEVTKRSLYFSILKTKICSHISFWKQRKYQIFPHKNGSHMCVVCKFGVIWKLKWLPRGFCYPKHSAHQAPFYKGDIFYFLWGSMIIIYVVVMRTHHG